MWRAVVCLGVVRLKLDVQGQVGGRSLDVDGQGGGGSLENWIIFMNVVCVSSIIKKSDFFFYFEGWRGRKGRKMRVIAIHNYSWTQSQQNYILLKRICSPRKETLHFSQSWSFLYLLHAKERVSGQCLALAKFLTTSCHYISKNTKITQNTFLAGLYLETVHFTSKIPSWIYVVEKVSRA